MASNWFSDFDDEFFSRPSRLRLLRTDPWGSLERLHEDLGVTDIFSDFSTKVAHLRSRVDKGRRQPRPPLAGSGLRRTSEQSMDGVASPTPSSVNSSAFSYPDGQVSFPTSSCSNVSDCSDKSAESICTEKSATHSAVSETLPDGGEHRQVDSTESWVKRDACGSVVGQGSASETHKSEIRPGSIQEYSRQHSSYVGASPTTSVTTTHTSEERSSQTSSSKTITNKSTQQGNSSIHQANETSSGKPFRVPPNRSIFYDELDSSLLAGPRRRARPLDRLASLVDEVAHHDLIFQSELDDFFNGRTRRMTSSNFFSSSAPEKEPGLNRCKLSNEDLRRENETLHQENLRLQQVLQEVTTVNKRWQRYNNDRRMYVQKLLATIQDLQEQMNQQGEAALQRPAPMQSADVTEREILERLHKQHEEHVQHLRLQIKSHKDDWEVELREKNKIVKEKETLLEEILKLKQELAYLRNTLEEERNRATACSCHINDTCHVSSQDFSPRPTYQASFQVPYSPVEEMSSANTEPQNVTFNIIEPGDTTCCTEEHCDFRNSECGEFHKIQPRSLYLGFSDTGLSSVRAFSSHTDQTYKADSSSLAGPSDTSHEGKQQESVICPNCSRVFPPSRHLRFLDHFEFCQSSEATNEDS